MESRPTERSIKRILVALDASRHSRAALEAAAALAAPINAELVGLFVKDEDLIRMAELALTHQVGQFPAGLEPSGSREMERQLRAQARLVERLLRTIAQRTGLAWSFQVVHGNVKAQLLAASEQVDLVTVGRLGHSAQQPQRFGSTTQALLTEASCPVLILQHGVRLHPAVVVLYDGSEASERALHMAAQITQRARHPVLNVLAIASDTHTEEAITVRISTMLKPYKVHVVLRILQEFSSLHVASLIQMGQEGLLIVPRSLLGDNQDRLDLLFTSRIYPVLLVK